MAGADRFTDLGKLDDASKRQASNLEVEDIDESLEAGQPAPSPSHAAEKQPRPSLSQDASEKASNAESASTPKVHSRGFAFPFSPKKGKSVAGSTHNVVAQQQAEMLKDPEVEAIRAKIKASYNQKDPGRVLCMDKEVFFCGFFWILWWAIVIVLLFFKVTHELGQSAPGEVLVDDQGSSGGGSA